MGRCGGKVHSVCLMLRGDVVGFQAILIDWARRRRGGRVLFLSSG
jgi:hypothetical protein